MPLPKKWSTNMVDLDEFKANKDITTLDKEAKATKDKDAIAAVNVLKTKFGNWKVFMNPKNPKPVQAKSMVKVVIGLFNDAIDEINAAGDDTDDGSDGGWTLTGKLTVPDDITESAKGVWTKFANAVKGGKHPKNAAKAAGDTNYKALGGAKKLKLHEIRLSGSERVEFRVLKNKGEAGGECEIIKIGGHT